MSEMGNGRVISAPTSFMVILRHEFYAITNDAAAAAVLNFYEYEYPRNKWRDGWHSIGIRKLKKRLFDAFGEDRLNAAINRLVQCGFLEKRSNRNPFVRAPEYRINVPVVQAAVDQWVQQAAPVAETAGEIPVETPITGIRLWTTGNPASSAVNPVVDGVESGMSTTGNHPIESGESGRDSRSSFQIFFSDVPIEKAGALEDEKKAFESFKSQLELQAGAAVYHLRDMQLARVEDGGQARRWVIWVQAQAMPLANRFERLMTNLLKAITGQAITIMFEPKLETIRPVVTAAADRYAIPAGAR